MSYTIDRQWSDQFIPSIKTIVGPLLLVETPDEIDCNQAADLMVFSARNIRIAARVRRHGYADRFPYEFTLRCARDSGAETELSKIIDGWGDWMFYGHASTHEGVLLRWWIIDLAIFRASLIRDRNNDRILCGKKSNGDGTHFAWFDLRSFPESLVVASGVAPPLGGV